MSLAWGAYRLLAPALGALAPAASFFAPARDRDGWEARLGRIQLDGGCDAWVHAASMGEAGAVAPLIGELAALEPGARFLLTATTRTGAARLAGLGAPVSLAPIDSPQAVRRFFEGASPRRLFLVETELWPHWLLRARAARVPVAVVSARLSERSIERYRQFGRTFAGLVHGLEAVICQSERDAQRWLSIGARPGRVAVAGNLKNDGLPRPAASRAAARLELGLPRERPLLVLGSVRPREVRLLARAWRALPDSVRARWQVVAVPRHARASAELRDEARRSRVTVVPGGAPGPDQWRWDDRPGVLASWYGAAEVAFVGGSLAPYGGHNPLEPAACGAAVIMGPHHESQREGVRALAAAGGLRIVRSEAELIRVLEVLLGDATARETAAGAALAAANATRGAAARTAAQLAIYGLWPTA